jgi:hypothetical protein
VFRVYPHELDCDVVEEVIESLGLSETCVLTSVLEEASAVLAVKARVKGATWLRHAARARGMPIYALKAEGIPQLARAIQAMLGLNAHSALAESSGASAAAKGPAGVRTPAGTLGVSSSEGAGANHDGLEGDLPSFGPNVSSSAAGDGARPRSIPAEETDALDEVRMAVEQLVIPHQEPVELLPRDARLLAMQKELIEREYRLEHEECGEGNARRIRILHTYVKSA